MATGSFVGTRGSPEHLRWCRYVDAFAAVERKQRRMRDRMWAAASRAVEGRRRSDAEWSALLERITAACDRVFPFPTYADVEHLPLPEWSTEPLTCETCGTVHGGGHLVGARITQCYGCMKPIQSIVGGGVT